jgi:hypothetical protein
LSGHVPGRARRPIRTTAAIVAAVAVTFSLSLTGQALARGSDHPSGHAHAVPPPPAQPTSDDQIQNIDQVRTAIKAYYGDTPTNVDDPVPDAVDGATTKLHTFDPQGAYAQQMAGIVARAERYLRNAGHGHARGAAKHSGHKAILLDIDDTTLNTYNYEIYSNFVYNPTTNAAFVNAAAFPAVPGMPGLVDYAKAHGYTVFFLTGRPDDQRPGTEQNLTEQGYDVTPSGDPENPDNVYLKGESKSWITCDTEGDAHCTTIERKSQTRAHIERDLGYDIVANFGDQYSDLTGGFADRTFKLPNPMYYLP